MKSAGFRISGLELVFSIFFFEGSKAVAFGKRNRYPRITELYQVLEQTGSYTEQTHISTNHDFNVRY